MMTKLHIRKSKNYRLLFWFCILHSETQTIRFNTLEHKTLYDSASRNQSRCGNTLRGSNSYVTSTNCSIEKPV